MVGGEPLGNSSYWGRKSLPQGPTGSDGWGRRGNFRFHVVQERLLYRGESLNRLLVSLTLDLYNKMPVRQPGAYAIHGVDGSHDARGHKRVINTNFWQIDDDTPPDIMPALCGVSQLPFIFGGQITHPPLGFYPKNYSWAHCLFSVIYILYTKKTKLTNRLFSFKININGACI